MLRRRAALRRRARDLPRAERAACRRCRVCWHPVGGIWLHRALVEKSGSAEGADAVDARAALEDGGVLRGFARRVLAQVRC